MLGLWTLIACRDGPEPSIPTIPAPPPSITLPAPIGACRPGPDPCDGHDSDCDGRIDEDPDRIWYLDSDLDGAGSPDRRDAVAACELPAGYVATSDDCNDRDPTIAGERGDLYWEAAPPFASGLLLPHWDKFSRPCTQEELIGGAAVGDIDGDGDPDLFLPRLYQRDALLRNDGTGRFLPAPGLPSTLDGGSSGALFVDVDGDRDLDLFAVSLGEDRARLYLNDGTGRFTEDAVARGVALPPGGCSDQYGVSAGDVDGDGDLDLLVAGWQEEMELGTGDRTRLLLNDGTGHFTDATAAWGLDTARDHAVFGMLLHDVDRDGRQDLHMVADWGGSALWHNTGSSFVRLSDVVFSDENGMGSDLGDVDGDGDLDWFISGIYDDVLKCPPSWGCSGNRLYRSEGAGYVDGTADAGVAEGQWTWGSIFVDHDLDGDLDLVTTGGFNALQFLDRSGRVWRNDGAGHFDEITCASGWSFHGQGRTLLPLDADGDGDQDLLLVSSSDPPSLWLAHGAEGNGWLQLELEQPGPNPYGIGAEITVRSTPTGPSQVRLLHANTLYMGGPEPRVHLGLGPHTGPVHEVRVRWPDGVETVHTDVGPGRVRLSR
ncbi:MAG TPA: CRTAC1 family protein [Deltaproteobacteria bacterium]|nr:CRTAC1 family protein [Deltaproteobacteria bacterium]